MKLLLPLLFSCIAQAAVAAPVNPAAAPLKPVAQKNWLGALAGLGASMRGLNEGMRGIEGLGKNLAPRSGEDAPQLNDLGKILKNLDLIKPVAEMDFTRNDRH